MNLHRFGYFHECRRRKQKGIWQENDWSGLYQGPSGAWDIGSCTNLLMIHHGRLSGGSRGPDARGASGSAPESTDCHAHRNTEKPKVKETCITRKCDWENLRTESSNNAQWHQTATESLQNHSRVDSLFQSMRRVNSFHRPYLRHI